MANLNLSDTEQRIHDFQSRLRADYAAKIQENANLTDVVAKLQTQLLDVEYENNVLRQRLVASQNERKASKTGASSQEKETIHQSQVTSVYIPNNSKRPSQSQKRKKKSSLNVVDTDGPPFKKVKPPMSSSNPTRQERSSCKASNSDAAVQTRRRAASSSSSSSGETLPLVPAKDQRNKTNFALAPSTVQKYLRAAQAFSIHPPPVFLEMSERFLKTNYQGRMRNAATCPKDKNPSGKWSRHMFIQGLDQSPDMPSCPGHPGLILNFPLRFVPGVLMWTVFCTQRKAGTVMCRYMGEYDIAPIGKMSASCFATQLSTVKQNWAEHLLEKKGKFGYRDICARIALRFASIIPLDNEEEEKRLIEEEANKIKAGNGRPISTDNIIDAFSKGEEKIDIFLMKCLSYDHVFATDIETRLANGTVT